MVKYYIPENYLFHHGIKGQKWGVRRYQYYDGTLTPLGEQRYLINRKSESTGINKVKELSKIDANQLKLSVKTRVTGKQYVDGIIKKGTLLKRIQTTAELEDHAYYATYKKKDNDKYLHLFGKNLKKRAVGYAKNNKQISDDERAEYVEKAKKTKVYQLSIIANKNLRIASDDNLSQITANLLKDFTFKKNLEDSILNAKQSMIRPKQQMLFDKAQKALHKKQSELTVDDRNNIYKALNLTLTFHDKTDLAVQNKFYSELKKKGYGALLDYNDKEYSSYKADRPMIIFDNKSTKLNSVSEVTDKEINKKYGTYQIKRLLTGLF